MTLTYIITVVSCCWCGDQTVSSGSGDSDLGDLDLYHYSCQLLLVWGPDSSQWERGHGSKDLGHSYRGMSSHTERPHRGSGKRIQKRFEWSFAFAFDGTSYVSWSTSFIWNYMIDLYITVICIMFLWHSNWINLIQYCFLFQCCLPCSNRRLSSFDIFFLSVLLSL